MTQNKINELFNNFLVDNSGEKLKNVTPSSINTKLKQLIKNPSDEKVIKGLKKLIDSSFNELNIECIRLLTEPDTLDLLSKNNLGIEFTQMVALKSTLLTNPDAQAVFDRYVERVGMPSQVELMELAVHLVDTRNNSNWTQPGHPLQALMGVLSLCERIDTFPKGYKIAMVPPHPKSKHETSESPPKTPFETLVTSNFAYANHILCKTLKKPQLTVDVYGLDQFMEISRRTLNISKPNELIALNGLTTFAAHSSLNTEFKDEYNKALLDSIRAYKPGDEKTNRSILTSVIHLAEQDLLNLNDYQKYLSLLYSEQYKKGKTFFDVLSEVIGGVSERKILNNMLNAGFSISDTYSIETPDQGVVEINYVSEAICRMSVDQMSFALQNGYQTNTYFDLVVDNEVVRTNDLYKAVEAAGQNLSALQKFAYESFAEKAKTCISANDAKNEAVSAMKDIRNQLVSGMH